MARPVHDHDHEVNQVKKNSVQFFGEDFLGGEERRHYPNRVADSTSRRDEVHRAMPRHSKNNTASAVFSYDERKKLNWGTQKVRLGKDSIKDFDACCICLHQTVDPLLCSKGHLFCKGCIYESLLAQKQHVKAKLAQWEVEEKERMVRKCAYVMMRNVVKCGFA